MSPLALGTMTFGWCADLDAARAIFDAYVGRGGNFVDTANGYAELIPMAATMGLGVVAWSPLAGGVLTGKYRHADLTPEAGYHRKAVAVANGFLNERGLAIADVVREVTTELDTTPSRVALAWTLLNPAVVAPIVGARTQEQLDDNFGVLDIALDPKQQARLAEVSAVDLGFPHETLRRLGYSS